MLKRPFQILGIQQIAIGSEDKQRLRRLWIDLLGFEYNYMTHTKYTPFIFSYDEFKESVDKRNMIIKEYDGKSLYSIFFDDIIEEFEQTEQIEYDGNQLEFMCSSKKYYYHVIARR